MRRLTQSLIQAFVCAMAVLAASPVLALPKVVLSAAVDHPRAKVGVSGSGFGANQAVDIYFDNTDMVLAVTDSKGKFSSHKLKVSGDCLPGEHWITAIGRRDGDAAQRLFTVSAYWAERGFGPNGKRVNPYENVITPANVGRLDTLWRSADTGELVASSPAVAGNIVYVVSSNRILHALDTRTGSELWGKGLGGTVFSFSSPAVVNGIVYVGSPDNNLHAFDATSGAVVWNAPTGDLVTTAPTVANGIVYVGSDDHKLYAFDAASGAPKWSMATGGLVESSPAVGGGIVYVGSSDHKLYAFDAITGARPSGLRRPERPYFPHRPWPTAGRMWDRTTPSSIASTPSPAALRSGA